MGITFNGLSSGIDTDAIIRATLAAQRTPIQQLENRKLSYNARISALGEIASKLGALESLAKGMSKASNVLAFQIGVGDEEVIGATADGESVAGSYELEVQALARAEKNRSVAFASAFSQVKAGTLTIATAGDSEGPHTITIEEGDSLDDVVDRINGSAAKVSASIISDGTSSYLQIVASESGHVIGESADDAITISESYTGSDGAELGLVQVSQARNALLTVDGLAAESRSNEPTHVIPGVAVALKKTGSSTLDIAADKTGTKDKLKQFVDLTNEVIDLVNKATRTSDGARSVEPDPTIERLGVEIRKLVAHTLGGGAGNITSLTRLGIKTDSSGRLSIDDKVLDKVLNDDPRGVARLFTEAESGLSTTVQALTERYTNGVDGIVGNRKKALNQRVDQLDSQIERMELRLDRLQTTMQRQFTAMEKALASYQAQGSALASLYLQ